MDTVLFALGMIGALIPATTGFTWGFLGEKPGAFMILMTVLSALFMGYVFQVALLNGGLWTVVAGMATVVGILAVVVIYIIARKRG